MIFTDKLNLAQYIGQKSAVPVQVATAIVSAVKRQRILRKIDADKHWAMYTGNHSDYFRVRKDEDSELFGYRKKNAVVANYVRYVVDHSGKYLYGRASKVSRTFSKNTQTDERMRKLIKMMGYDAHMLEAAKKSGIFGEIGFRLIPIDSTTGDQPDGLANVNTVPMPILLDPTKTFFLTNKWNRITAVVIEDEYTDYTSGIQSRVHKTMELIVGDSRWFWDDQGTGYFDMGTVPKLSSINLYNLNEEFVLCKNNDAWIDDIQDILGLNIQMDEALTDCAHFFARHGWPQLISSVDLKSVQHSPTHAWEIPSDGPNDKVADKVMFLQWDGRMEEANKFIQYLESLIFKVSNTARVATGDVESIGQLRSGPAIVTAHSPSIQKTQEKQVTWSDNEFRLLNAIAAFDAKLHGQAVASRYPELDVNITFPRDFVPGEELVRAQVFQILANSHLMTFSDQIRQTHPEFSETEVEEYRKELIKDSHDIVDSEREFVTTQSGAGAKPSGQSGSAKQKSTEQK